jgi:alkylation response protein AidB-like acyl-CoA dehydrogenase
MDYSLTQLPQEHQQLKMMVREVVDRECMPLEVEYLKDDLYDQLKPEHEPRLRKVSQETGIWDAHVPTEFGGGGMGLLGLCVIDEEIFRSAVLLPKSPVNVILYECNENQQDNYLYPVIQGEKRTAFAQTEPQSGSDPGGSMETRAVKNGDTWTINGHKFFISNSLTCDFWMLQAVTDSEKRRRGGITMFLIDQGTPGIHISEIKTWHNRPPDRATCELVLENVSVPNSNVLGDVGQGFRLGQRWLVAHDRLIRGASSLGQMQRALDLSIDWARQRHSFGKPIASRQAIQWMIVDMFVDIQALRSLTYAAAIKYDAAEDADSRYLGSLIKLLSGEWGHRCLDKAMQVHGGIGETYELPISRFYRNLRHARIGGGTDEMHRMVLARWLLGRDATDV